MSRGTSAITVLALTMFSIGFALFVGTLLRGWALALVWSWHIVPLGGPPLEIWHAYGIVCVLGIAAPPTGSTTWPWKSAEQKRDEAETPPLTNVLRSIGITVAHGAGTLLAVFLAWAAWRMGQP